MIKATFKVAFYILFYLNMINLKKGDCMKVVLITGASSDIGKEIALKFSLDSILVLTYNKSLDKVKKLKEKLDEINANYLFIKCDLTKEEDINNLYNEVKEQYNKVDILINNAALEYNTDFNLKTKQDFIDVLNVNLVGPFLLSRLIGNLMYEQKSGKIINIATNNAIDKYDSSTLEYDTSKSGLITLTHILAKHYAPYVNVNAIAPGWIMTDKVSKLNDDLDGMLVKEESKNILKNRFGEPKEVADLVYFLGTADYINNEVIRIDGGVM